MRKKRKGRGLKLTPQQEAKRKRHLRAFHKRRKLERQQAERNRNLASRVPDTSDLRPADTIRLAKEAVQAEDKAEHLARLLREEEQRRQVMELQLLRDFRLLAMQLIRAME